MKAFASFTIINKTDGTYTLGVSNSYAPIATGLSQRHAAELAKRFNQLLEMPEDELCPPVCHRCGVPGRIANEGPAHLELPLLQQTALARGKDRSLTRLLCDRCSDVVWSVMSQDARQ